MSKVIIPLLSLLIFNNSLFSQEEKKDIIDKISCRATSVIKNNHLTVLYTQFSVNGSRINNILHELRGTNASAYVLGRTSNITLGCLADLQSKKHRSYKIQYGLAYHRTSADLANRFNVETIGDIKKGHEEKNRTVRNVISNQYVQIPLFVKFLGKEVQQNNAKQQGGNSLNLCFWKRGFTLGIVPSFLLNSNNEKILDIGDRRMFFTERMMNRFRLEASLQFNISNRVGVYVNYNLRSSFKSRYYTKNNPLTSGFVIQMF